MQVRVKNWVNEWLKAAAEREGFMYQGRPSVARLLTAIAEGKYQLTKIEVAKED